MMDVEIRFLGHSCFMLSAEGHRVIIDPFLSGNPKAAVKAEEVEVEAVLLTHGHSDHVGDAVPIARRTGATIIAPFELAMYCQKQGASVHAMHIGGAHQFPFGWVKLTPAWHGSGADDGQTYAGTPCGVLVRMGGRLVYHAGDTALFGDMELIGRRHPIDVALLPIGDNFTMGPEDAAYAVSLLKPKLVVPMHYGTFPLIDQDPDRFARLCVGTGAEVKILAPGESLTL